MDKDRDTDVGRGRKTETETETEAEAETKAGRAKTGPNTETTPTEKSRAMHPLVDDSTTHTTRVHVRVCAQVQGYTCRRTHSNHRPGGTSSEYPLI